MFTFACSPWEGAREGEGRMGGRGKRERDREKKGERKGEREEGGREGEREKRREGMKEGVREGENLVGLHVLDVGLLLCDTFQIYFEPSQYNMLLMLP